MTKCGGSPEKNERWVLPKNETEGGEDKGLDAFWIKWGGMGFAMERGAREVGGSSIGIGER